MAIDGIGGSKGIDYGLLGKSNAQVSSGSHFIRFPKSRGYDKDLEQAMQKSPLDSRMPNRASLKKAGFSGGDKLTMDTNGGFLYSNERGDTVRISHDAFVNGKAAPQAEYKSHDGKISQTIVYDQDGNPFKGYMDVKQDDGSIVKYQYEYDIDGNTIIKQKTVDKPKLEKGEQTSVDLQKLEDKIKNDNETVHLLRKQKKESDFSGNTAINLAKKIANSMKAGEMIKTPEIIAQGDVALVESKTSGLGANGEFVSDTAMLKNKDYKQGPAGRFEGGVYYINKHDGSKVYVKNSGSGDRMNVFINGDTVNQVDYSSDGHANGRMSVKQDDGTYTWYYYKYENGKQEITSVDRNRPYPIDVDPEEV